MNSFTLDNTQKGYMVLPGVYPVGKTSHVTIFPMQRAFSFCADRDYPVFVLPMEEEKAIHVHEPDLILHGNKRGTLEFDYPFDREQKYFIKIGNTQSFSAKTESTIKLEVYAVTEELYELTPLKGDFHIHTCRSDGIEDPAQVALNCRAEGFDVISITDHNRRFGSEEAIDSLSGIFPDMNICYGEEVHTPGSNLHIVHPFATGSVCEQYVKNPDRYEAEWQAIESTLAEEMPFRRKYAKAIWATNMIHELGDIAILPHPYWMPNVHNLAEDFFTLLYKSGLFDAYELIGAQEVYGNNLSVMRWAEFTAEGIRMPIVGESDTHKTLGYDHSRMGRLYTVLYAKQNTREDVIDAIRSFRTVPVETSLDQPDEYHVYGTYRLCSYTRFLLDNYFVFTRLLGLSEALIGREFILSGRDSLKDAMQNLKGRQNDYRDMFFGRKSPELFNSSYASLFSDFSARWNGYGVTTKGSAISLPAVYD